MNLLTVTCSIIAASVFIKQQLPSLHHLVLSQDHTDLTRSKSELYDVYYLIAQEGSINCYTPAVKLLTALATMLCIKYRGPCWRRALA